MRGVEVIQHHVIFCLGSGFSDKRESLLLQSLAVIIESFSMLDHE